MDRDKATLAHSQYSNILSSIRQSLQSNPAILAMFDSKFRTTLCNFNFNDFVNRGCTLTWPDRINALLQAREHVISHITDLEPVERSDSTNRIYYELTSSMIQVALDGLKPLIEHKYFSTLSNRASANQPKAKPQSTPQQSRLEPKPSTSQQSKQPQPAAQNFPPLTCEMEIEIRGLVSRHSDWHSTVCPNRPRKCTTCSSVYGVLPLTPCEHRGDWCCKFGYYPHFTRKLQAHLRTYHERNVPVPSDVLNQLLQADDVNLSEVASVVSTPHSDSDWYDPNDGIDSQLAARAQSLNVEDTAFATIALRSQDHQREPTRSGTPTKRTRSKSCRGHPPKRGK